MNLFAKEIIAATALLCTSCAAAPEKTPTPELCKQIHEFSEGLGIGGSRSAAMRTEQGNGILPTKICKPSGMDAKEVTLCKWLSALLSAEFMAANISRVVACFTDSKSLFSKGVQINELSGKFTISEPYKDIKNIDIDVEYAFKNSIEDRRNYFAITVRGVQNAD